MNLENAPIVRAAMLIRKPVADVFNAFVDPAITSRFWFTRGSGPLQPGAKVTWYWDMYGVSADINVKAIEQDRRIVIEWPSPVEWEFTPRSDNTTYVQITTSGFVGSQEEKTAQAIDAMGGFSFLLAGAKAYLEHGIELNLVSDHHPDAHVVKK